MATRFLKKWVALARPADPSRLYLPTTEGGLGLPAISTCYQKQQASVASLLLTSPDPIIQHTAKLAVMKEENLRRPLHRPMLEELGRPIETNQQMQHMTAANRAPPGSIQTCKHNCTFSVHVIIHMYIQSFGVLPPPIS